MFTGFAVNRLPGNLNDMLPELRSSSIVSSATRLLVLLMLTCEWAYAAEPPITAIAFSSDGKSVVAVSQSGLQEFNWPQLEPQRIIGTSAANLHGVVFSPNGTRIAVAGGNPAEEGIVEIFSWPKGELQTRISGHDDSVRSVVWLDDSRIVTSSIDRQIKLWSLDNKLMSRTFRGHSRSVTASCVLKGGKTLVSTGVDQTVRVWDISSAKLIRSLSQHTKPIHSVVRRPQSGGLPMVATASADRSIRFWQPTIGRMVRYIRLESEPLNIAWLDKGTKIAAVCVDGRVRIIDADEVKVLQSISAIDGLAYSIAVHPNDGSLAVGGTNGQIRRIVP